MREVAKIIVGVAAAECVLWGVGIWRWVSHSLTRWPWLLQAYALVFPLILALGLLLVRRWKPARSQLIVAGACGACVGLLASEASRFLAFMGTAEHREVLWNTWSMATFSDLLIVESLFAFSLTLGWLYGGLAAMLTTSIDLATARFIGSHE